MGQGQWWDYVKLLLDARGWTRADLAHATGIDQSVIGRWERRGSTPSPRLVRIVAEAFDRDVREAAIAAGHYTAEELAGADGADPFTVDLTAVPHERLMHEVYSRVAGRSHAPHALDLQHRPGTRTSTAVRSTAGRGDVLVRDELLPAQRTEQDAVTPSR